MNPRYALDDHFLRDRIRQIIVERDLTTVVETGIADGNSSFEFCQMPIARYIGIDADPARIDQTRANLELMRENAVLCPWALLQGNSPDVLRQIMPTLVADRTLFFL